MALVQRVACDLEACDDTAPVEERRQGRGKSVSPPEDWITVKVAGSEFHLSTWDCLSLWTDERVKEDRPEQVPEGNGRARPVQRRGTEARRPGA